MKTKLLLSLIFAFALFNSYGVNYVSSGSGPWETPGTWSPAGTPTLTDNVTISAGHVVTVNAVNDKCNDLTINGQLRWAGNIAITVQGNYNITSTGSESGTGLVQFNPPGTTVTCTGTSSPLVYYSFYTFRTITAGSVINKSSTTTKIQNGKYVNNLGTYFTGIMDARPGSAWYNGATGVVNIKNAGFMAGEIFNCNAVGNTVNIQYTTGALPATVAGFYNLNLASVTAGVKTLPAATIVNGSLTINALNTLNSNNFNLTVGGNWTNNGVFTQGVRTVTFNGSGAQAIGGSVNTTFYDLVRSGTGTATLTRNLVVTHLLNITGGVLSTGTFGLTGAAGLTQSGGELRLARISATLPELTGAYNLTGGKVNFAGAGVQTIRPVTYSGVDVTGSGIKSLAAPITINGSLFISSTLDVTASNFTLNLGGNFTNNGTFNSQLGTVNLNGTAATQIISGSSSTTFENLTLSNSNGATITGGTYLLNGALTISSGTFNTGGNSFTMTSTAAKTARIAPITGTGSIAGNFIIQRFITTRDTTWADLSSTVQATTFNDWDNELPAISYLYAPPAQYPTQYTYSEPADDFVPVTSAATALTPGKGFEVFLAGSYSYSNLPNMVINTVGVPNQGNQDLSALVSFSGAGSNLVGNPFASSISWTSVFTASSRLLSTYDVYDFTAGNYSTQGLGTEIGSGQGFWVYSTGGSPQLVINENAKTTSSNSSLRSVVAEPYFTLKLSSNDANNTYYHVLKIAANAESSDAWDDNDHPYHKSPNRFAPSIVSLSDGKKLSINSFSSSNIAYSMPLETKAGIAGYYKIEAAGFENISDEYNCIKLEDKLLNRTVALSDGAPYAFEMNAGDDANRFIVHFSKNCDDATAANASAAVQKGLNADFENHVNILPSSEGNLVLFNLDEATNAIISVTNVLGQTIAEPVSVIAQSQSVTLNIPRDFSGMYIVKVESEKGTTIKKFIRK